jgi:hypothetical protein
MLLDPGLCAALRGLGSAISILVMLMAAWAIVFSGMLHVALLAALRNGRTYLERSLLRCFFSTSPSAGRARASSACLASLSARRRSMFLRTAAALCSTSIIARTPSSWASLRRLARATLAGDGSADFLLTIFPYPDSQASKPAQSWDRAGTRPFQYIREMASAAQASDRFSALVLPHILSVLSSKLTF